MRKQLMATLIAMALAGCQKEAPSSDTSAMGNSAEAVLQARVDDLEKQLAEQQAQQTLSEAEDNNYTGANAKYGDGDGAAFESQQTQSKKDASITYETYTYGLFEVKRTYKNGELMTAHYTNTYNGCQYKEDYNTGKVVALTKYGYWEMPEGHLCDPKTIGEQ